MPQDRELSRRRDERSAARRSTDEASPSELAAMHRAYATTRQPALQAQLLERYQGLARSLAARFARAGDDFDDLLQVAMVGVLYALDRYDPDRGVEFTTFAWATIQGELKRHSRDRGWAVHVPRRLQEAYLRVTAAREELSSSLGRQPTLPEIAQHTGDDVEVVIQAIEVRSARRPASIDIRPGESRYAGWDPGVEDRRFAAFDDRSLVAALLPRLGPRERQIIELRFIENLTQAQIAAHVGCSQMHVSRILSRALARLRAWAEIDGRAVPRRPTRPEPQSGDVDGTRPGR